MAASWAIGLVNTLVVVVIVVVSLASFLLLTLFSSTLWGSSWAMMAWSFKIGLVWIGASSWILSTCACRNPVAAS